MTNEPIGDFSPATLLRVKRLLLLVPAVRWLCLAAIGLQLILSVYEQHVPGYPNAAQFCTGLGLPLAVGGLLVALNCIAHRLPGILCGLTALAAVFGLPVGLLMLGGGV